MRIKNISSYGLTLSESKNYLKVEVSDDDLLISSFITASYDQCVYECNRDFVMTSITQSIFSSSGAIYLSTQTVESVSTGSLLELNGTYYTNLDSTYTGIISFVVNTTASVVPNAVKVCQMMLCSQWYDNREAQVIGVSATKLDFTVEQLLSPYKLVRP